MEQIRQLQEANEVPYSIPRSALKSLEVEWLVGEDGKTQARRPRESVLGVGIVIIIVIVIVIIRKIRNGIK